MDLDKLGCQLLCVEHDNGNGIKEYLEYCQQWNFKEVARTKVNLILTR